MTTEPSEGYVLQQVRRTTRNLRRAGVILVLLVLAAAGISWRYLYNLATGPHVLDATQLAAITDADAGRDYFVTVTGDRVIDWGLKRIQRRTRSGKTVSESTVASFVALAVGERLLLVRTATVDTERKSYSGALRTLDGELRRDFLEPLQRQQPEAAARFLPNWLEADGDFAMPSWWLLPIGTLLLAWGASLLLKASRRSRDPAVHPVFARLAQHGDVTAVVAQIDAEAAGPTQQRLGVVCSPNWLLRPRPFGLETLRLDDVAWGYLKVTRRRVNGVPAGSTFSAVVHDTGGRSMEVTGKEAECKAWLEQIAQRAPWALFGHSDELQKAWNKRRSEVLAAVATRRQTQAGGNPNA